MLLERLSICNYGVYAKKNDFDLAVTPESPIILVGGLNGAGKTTILESLMVALYGRTYFGTKRPKKDYLEFIHNRIHKSEKVRAEHASIEVAFRFYHNGSEDIYVINRRWDVEGASVSESFTIQKNDQRMDDIDESQWQSFIEGLLPIGIARLFFFDGEKIVRIAENQGQYNKEIKTSLETLIGAELVNRLHADLNLYILRKSDNKDNGIVLQYDQMNKEKTDLTSDIESLYAERDAKNAELERVNAVITAKESSVSGMGGGYADIRGSLLTKKITLEEKARNYTRQIHAELAEDAPFYLMPSMMRKVIGTVRDDLDTFVRNTASTSAPLVASLLKEKLDDPEFWPDGVDGKYLTKKILDTIQGQATPGKQQQFFDLSDEDQEILMQVFGKIKAGHKSLSGMIDEYAQTMADLEKTESEIARIPKDDELGPRISEINAMHQDVGLLQGELAHINQQISSKNAYKKILQSRLRKMLGPDTKQQERRCRGKDGIKDAESIGCLLCRSEGEED